MHLTQEERRRFIEWCEWEAHVNKGLIEQMKKLPNAAVFILLKEKEMNAVLTIAHILRATEETSL